MASLWRAYQACFAASTNEVFRLFWYCRINTNTYIVVKYKIHLYSLRNRPEKLAILPVSKARTNKFYIYRQCTYIVYIYIYLMDLKWWQNISDKEIFLLRVSSLQVKWTKDFSRKKYLGEGGQNSINNLGYYHQNFNYFWGTTT